MATSTGDTFGNAATTAQLGQGGSTDNNDWGGESFLLADDAQYAYISDPTFDTDDCSYSVIVTNFGFSIDGEATIDGVMAKVERTYLGGAVSDFGIQLYNSGLIGNNQTSGRDWGAYPLHPTVEVATVGGSSDKWGATLTPAVVNAETFGVAYVCQATGENADAYVDYIALNIYYTEGAGGFTKVYIGGASNTIIKTTDINTMMVE